MVLMILEKSIALVEVHLPSILELVKLYILRSIVICPIETMVLGSLYFLFIPQPIFS